MRRSETTNLSVNGIDVTDEHSKISISWILHTMMRSTIVFSLANFCLNAVAAPPIKPAINGDWSTEVNGIRGRLVLTESGKDKNEMRIGLVYVELQNVARGGTQYIYYDAKKGPFNPALRDSEGREVKNWISASDFIPEPCWLAMPYGSTLRFPTGNSSYSPENPGLFIVGAFMGGKWFIPDADAKDYYLSATFTASIPPDETRPRMWEGTLELPPIKIPRDKP